MSPCGWLLPCLYARKATYSRLLDLHRGCASSICIPAVAVSYASLLSLVRGVLLQAELCLRPLNVLVTLSSS